MMGLHPCADDPCACTGESPDGDTVCVGTCVDDVMHCGLTDQPKQGFKKELQGWIGCNGFMGAVPWCLGAHCEWSRTNVGRLTVHLSQEAHVQQRHWTRNSSWTATLWPHLAAVGLPLTGSLMMASPLAEMNPCSSATNQCWEAVFGYPPTLAWMSQPQLVF